MKFFSKNDSKQAIWLEYNGDKNWNRIPDVDEIGVHKFKGDGDFRSEECVEILKKADVVVTNPPFSLFREYIAQLFQYNKKFLIIGNQTAIARENIFKHMLENKLWFGYGFKGTASFMTNYENYNSGKQEGMIKVSGVQWFTNLEVSKRHEDLILTKKYTPEEYPFYDDYKAINVNKTVDIPMKETCEKAGIDKMGVPLTFMTKYNPNQFIILGMDRYINDNQHPGRGFKVNGKETYARIIIKHK